MAARKGVAGRPSASATAGVDAFLAGKGHPLAKEIGVVRKIVLGIDPSIREEVKWSSVSFRNAHDHFATVNLRSTESLRLVFHTGVKRKITAETGVTVDDPRGLVEAWPAKDRCIVNLGKGAAVRANAEAFRALVLSWLPFVR